MNLFENTGSTLSATSHRRKGGTLLFVTVLAIASSHSIASACTVCMGDANSQTAGAINAAIFLMLGLIGSILAGLCAFGLYLWKRASLPLPPHLEFAAHAGSGED